MPTAIGLEAADHDFQGVGQLLAQLLGPSLGHEHQVEIGHDDRREDAGGQGEQGLVGDHEDQHGRRQADASDIGDPLARLVDDAGAQHEAGEEAGAALAVLLEAPLLAQLQHQLAQRPGSLRRGKAPVHSPARDA